MQYSIENDILRLTVDSHGAEPVSVIHKPTGAELLWQADPAVWKRHAPILFPYTGKLTGGKMLAKGVEYAGGQHGFARDVEHTMTHHADNLLEFELHANAETLPKWPYAFVLRSTFTLEGETVHHTLTVENPVEDKLCFGIGYHPAFALPFDDRHVTEDYEIRFDGVESPLCVSAQPNGLLNGQSYYLARNVEAIQLTDDLFDNGLGDILAEIPADKMAALEEKELDYTVIGIVTEEPVFVYGDVKITMEEALVSWTSKLEKVFPTKAVKGTEAVASNVYKADSIYVCKHKIAKPTVFIPVFPGTNCEYDSTKAFERAGAHVETRVFRNMTAEDIRESVEEFEKSIAQAQIIMFPGGFSAGDEPDGSAKFFATAFQNEKLKEAVMKLLNERDGLALGICNGFQALIKLGLVPYGEITGQKEDSPTLTFNTINRHISKMVYTKVVSNKSPWLQGATLGATYCNPASHGEGRFVAPKEWIDKLFANGQVATQYADQNGNVSMDEEYNVNGSYCAIEGITSPDGRCLGKMAHSERRDTAVAMNIYGEQDMKIFESGVQYFK